MGTQLRLGQNYSLTSVPEESTLSIYLGRSTPQIMTLPLFDRGVPAKDPTLTLPQELISCYLCGLRDEFVQMMELYQDFSREKLITQAEIRSKELGDEVDIWTRELSHEVVNDYVSWHTLKCLAEKAIDYLDRNNLDGQTRVFFNRLSLVSFDASTHLLRPAEVAAITPAFFHDENPIDLGQAVAQVAEGFNL